MTCWKATKSLDIINTNINITVMKRCPVPSFSYSMVERALAFLLNIAPRQRGAFEARLRHLRHIGIPRSNKPGSGKRIVYERSHAAEMMVALLLQSIGCAPQLSVQAAYFAVDKLSVNRSPETLFVLLPDEKFDFVCADRLADLVACQRASSILNLPVILAELDARLTNERDRSERPQRSSTTN